MDLALLWLWCRPAAIALIRPLAWEPPYAAGGALKIQKKKKSPFMLRILTMIIDVANIFPNLFAVDFFFVFFFFFFFLAFSRAAPGAYGGSQASGQIGSVAAGLHHSHSTTGSEPCLQHTPQLTTMPYH